jgi:hypothetical protein
MELGFDRRNGLMIPCINKDMIKYLYNTADERYNFSKDFFRETHYPQVMTQYYNNEIIDKVDENQLLKELEEEHLFGNRVYIIFGSTGSGKSELLCWIKDQWNLRNNQRPIVRISRSELNPQLLVKKCYETFGLQLNDIIIDENKWGLFLNKPITIVNQMVWNVMSELFTKDEEIVPAAMLLRPIIEKNLMEFSEQIKKGEIITPLEIITQAQFEEAMEGTTITFQINYHNLRDLLLKKLDHFLFQGTDMIAIFKRLSSVLLERNIRPILLIDDLVQSINLYASEVLDYFITLEEGNWDVLIGLTPGVIDGNEYETQLKNRIKNLDTIDDRVKKLWLSDESGSNFFSFEREQAYQYVEKYLSALKKANGYNCSSKCSMAVSCSNLLIGSNSNLKELPLNPSLIHRMYDSIPDGKGVLRYLIIHLREILSFLEKGLRKNTTKVNKFFLRNVYVEHDDSLIKTLAEMYADDTLEVTLPGRLLEYFQYPNENMTLKIKRIHYKVNQPMLEENKPKNKAINPDLRDWLEGHKVNEQLLEPVRAGVFTIVNEFVKGTSIAMDNTPRMLKTASTIRRAEVKNRFKYPISFNEDKKDEIVIKKDINLFHISEYQQLKLQERVNIFSAIANDQNVAQWIHQGEQFSELWLSELSKEIGMEIDYFAFQFNLLIKKLSMLGKKEWTAAIVSPITKEWEEIAEALFLDWFLLRDNMLDFNKLDSMVEDQQFEEWLMTVIPSKTLNKYQINGISLQDFIIDVQMKISDYLEEMRGISRKKIENFSAIKDFVKLHSEEYYMKIVGILHLQTNHSMKLSEIMLIDEIETWFSEYYKEEYYSLWREQHRIEENIKRILPSLQKNQMKDISEKIMTLEVFQEHILRQLKIRKQVSHHLLNLIQMGQTNLPKKQWRGILRDLDELAPDLFDKLTIKIQIEENEAK